MTFTRTTTAAAVSIAAVTALLLTGCSAGQSKADACKSMIDQVKSVSSDIQSHASELQSDPTKASNAISKLASTFDSATKNVSEPTVKKVADKAAKSLDDFATEFTKVAADPSSAGSSNISSLASDISTNFNALQKVCVG